VSIAGTTPLGGFKRAFVISVKNAASKDLKATTLWLFQILSTHD
jgi:hypothetical protein